MNTAPAAYLHVLDTGSAATCFWRPGRMIAIVLASISALFEAAIRFSFAFSRKERATWLHQWCRVACALLGLRVNIEGMPPGVGLLVANHLSYLDVIALSSVRPCLFVAKREVARWPLFGWLARAAGTIFVERARRSDSLRGVDQIRRAFRDDVLVVLFPEGTSSDGATVLPFKSTLLEAAAISGATTISVAAIDYALEDGSVSDEVCYWREMVLLPHLWNLCGKRGVTGTIKFSSLAIAGRDRKQLARDLRASVCSLRRQTIGAS